MKINLIVCCDSKNGIAKSGEIPWYFADDMEWFKQATKNQIVIMGKKTWCSLKKELPDRHSIVLTKTVDENKPPETNIIDLVNTDTYIRSTAKNEEQALAICKLIQCFRKSNEIWIIGGQEVYKSFINNYYDIINKIYITKIDNDFNCDRYCDIENLLNKKSILPYYNNTVSCVDKKTLKSYNLLFLKFLINA